MFNLLNLEWTVNPNAKHIVELQLENAAGLFRMSHNTIAGEFNNCLFDLYTVGDAVTFKDVTFKNCTFNGCTFTNSNFNNCTFVNCNGNVICDGTVFRKCRFMETDIDIGSWSYFWLNAIRYGRGNYSFRYHGNNIGYYK